MLENHFLERKIISSLAQSKRSQLTELSLVARGAASDLVLLLRLAAV